MGVAITLRGKTKKYSFSIQKLLCCKEFTHTIAKPTKFPIYVFIVSLVSSVYTKNINQHPFGNYTDLSNATIDWP